MCVSRVSDVCVSSQIPWGEEFDWPCARELFGSNLLVLTWIKGESLPGNLVDDIMKAIGLERETVPPAVVALVLDLHEHPRFDQEDRLGLEPRARIHQIGRELGHAVAVVADRFEQGRAVVDVRRARGRHNPTCDHEPREPREPPKPTEPTEPAEPTEPQATFTI